MAPSLVGTPTSGSQGSGTTLATSFPAGWVANDVAYIFVDQTSGTGAPTTPTGWSIANSQTGANPRMWCYRRVLQAGDTAPTITVSSVGRNWSCEILRGVDTTTPEDGTASNATALTQAFEDAPSVTTTVDGDYLLTAYSNTAARTGTPPTGATELTDTTNSGTGMQVNGEVLGAHGATGTRRETLSGNGGNEAALTVAVRSGATTFTKSVSGSVSSSGALTKTPNKFGGNVLANPGAEDGTSGWSGGGWGIVNLDATHPHSGSTAFLLQSGVPSGAGDMALVSGYIPVVAGQLVHGEAWVRATGTGRVAYIEYQFWNAAQNAIVATLDGPQITDSATYQQLTYEAVTPSGVGAAYVQMWVWFKNCPQNETHDIDDLVLKLPASSGPAGVLTRRPGKAVGTPQLPNPGFESGTTGWSPSAFCTLSVDTTNFRSGSQSLLLTSTLTGDIFAESDLLGGFASGQAVHAEAWVKAHSSTNLTTIEIWYYDSSGAFVAKENGASVTDSMTGWTRVSYDSAAPTGTAAVKIRIGFSAVAVGNTKNIDDAILTTGVGLSGALARRTGKLFAGAVSSAGALNRQPRKALRGVMQLPYYINQFPVANVQDWIQDGGNASWGAGGGSLNVDITGADSVLLLDHPQMTDGYWEVKAFVSNVTGTPLNVAAGIKIRSAGAANTGYELICFQDGTVRFAAPYGGLVGPVMGPYTPPTSSGAAITLGLLAAGNVLTAYVNGVQAGTYTDTGSHYPGPGYVGLFVAGPGLSGDYLAFFQRFVAADHKPAPRERLVLQTGKPLSGTVTSNGSLVRNAGKMFTGAVTSAGALVRQPTKALAGAASSAGALTNRSGRAFAGSASSAGVLTNQPGKTLAGVLSPVGILVGLPQLSRGGTSSPSGALTKNLTHSFSGAADLAGALVRQSNNSFAGAVSSSGALAQARIVVLSVAGAVPIQGVYQALVGRVVAGLTTPAGALTNQSGNVFAGASTSAGALTFVTEKTLAGVVSSAGSVVRLAMLSREGMIGPSGELVKSLTHSFSGSIGSAGALDQSRVVLLFVAGVVSSSGFLVRQPAKLLVGFVDSNGALSRQGFRDLVGVVSPVGSLSQSIAKSLVGSSNPAGALQRAVARSLSGAVSIEGIYQALAKHLVTGSTTPSGVLTSQPRKALTGESTPTSVLAFVTEKTFIGVVSSSGLALRLVTISRAGTVGLSGALAKRLAHSFSGTISETGVLRLQPDKAMAGSVTSVGSVVRSAARRLVGAVSSHGGVVRFVARSFAGAVSPHGIYHALATRFVTGSVSSAGALKRSVIKRVDGQVSASGVLAYRLARSLRGSVSPVGVLRKASSRTFAGQLSASGVLRRSAQLRLAGEVTFSSTLDLLREKLLYFAGAVSAVGDIRLLSGRSFAGAVSGSGKLSRSLLRALSGQSESSGVLRLQVRATFAGRVDAVGELVRSVGLVLEGSVPTSGSLVRSMSRSLSGSSGASGSLVRRISRSFEGAISVNGGLRKRLVTVRPIRFFIGLLEVLTRVGELEADVSVATTDPLLAPGSAQPAIASTSVIESIVQDGVTPTEHLSELASTQMVAVEGLNFSIAEDEPEFSIADAEQSVEQDTEDVVAQTESDVLAVIETDGSA